MDGIRDGRLDGKKKRVETGGGGIPMNLAITNAGQGGYIP